ncbi:dTDP-4-dehydrorhamnose reductase [Alteromonas lipolytica]|uniref:dTDP-4-dehydrorhamnose reductase n=1 Tax=Alteromonas lipolytica TaxID=1856405 RepID=A0A1E8FEQ8_9ALTE|nr:dTDP-4-dehydrorhamnose reductase [Alteromonas lipolytica]OFI34437.1 dTDP-4-dehydrorhamnose reductase [Alteromonas lipolytica]GGF84520.1 NAD(P)-dependent oxidoreductase [Alteromonas lipolytica]
MTKLVVIGKSGQLAWEIARLLPDAVCLGRDDIDITLAEDIAAKLDTLKPDAVINASAYTAVDKAESDEANAYLINQTAVANLATYCKANNAFFVHVSTDYVFNGEKGSPYTVDDAIEPQGMYGKTKAAGEAEVTAILPEASAILRTSWVYASHGNNFVKTMLRLMAEKPQLGVIDDQIGSPTWAKGLARACVEAATQHHAGIYHWSDEGVCSWYDFAVAIQQLGLEKRLLTQAVPINPIPSSAYPTPAKRPHYSVLDKTLTRETFTSPLNHWREQLSAMMDELV